MAKARPTLADRIRDEIRRRDLSGYAVAQAVGVPAVTIQRFMRGAHTPKLETIERLIDLLGWEIAPRRRKP